MKVYRKRRLELGPSLTLDIEEKGKAVERRPAKQGGETYALLEAQRIAEAMKAIGIVRVFDEEDVVWVVLRDEDGSVLTFDRKMADRLEGVSVER